jgi:DHA1 family multidrug resistance protein-like MFS transporter/DHA1 family quinolone resistance protein-like MFS transporter
MIAGPYLGGLLFEIEKSVPILVAFGVFIVISVYVSVASIVFSRLRVSRRPRLIEEDPAESGAQDQSTFLRFPSWLVLCVTYAVRGVLVNVYPLYARSELFFSESRIGLLFLVRALCMTIGFLFLGRLVFWHFKRWWIISGLFATAIVLYLLMQAESFLSFTLLFALTGFVVSQTYTNSVFHGVSGSLQRTRRMAIHEALMSGGIMSGSAIGGMIYQTTSFEMALTVCLAIIGAAVGAAGIMLIGYAKRS